MKMNSKTVLLIYLTLSAIGIIGGTLNIYFAMAHRATTKADDEIAFFLITLLVGIISVMYGVLGFIFWLLSRNEKSDT